MNQGAAALTIENREAAVFLMHKCGIKVCLGNACYVFRRYVSVDCIFSQVMILFRWAMIYGQIIKLKYESNTIFCISVLLIDQKNVILISTSFLRYLFFYLVYGISPHYSKLPVTPLTIAKEKGCIFMNETQKQNPAPQIDWNTVCGPVAIPMTNDYLFRAILQKNNTVLKALISSLLHLDFETISSVEITNPIILGDSIDAKTFILDVKVIMNEHTVINLEMQVINEQDWPERSLLYLCRAFDNLNRGSNYLDVKPAIQIGLLDFTLFEDAPEFYATYYVMNEKTHRIYSDKIRLSVLDLTHIELATGKDKLHGIDHWASLFKATTWEELKMLSKSNEYLQEAVSTAYQLSQDERIRQQCEAREEYYRIENTRKLKLERAEDELIQRDQIIAEQKQVIADKEQAIADKDMQIQQLLKKLDEHGISAE